MGMVSAIRVRGMTKIKNNSAGIWGWVSGAALALILLGLFIPGGIYFNAALTSPSEWLEIKSFDVSDTIEGKSPLIRVEQIVHQDILVMRHSAIYKWDVRRSGWEPFCQRAVRRLLIQNMLLPSNTGLLLDYWMDIPPSPACPPLPPGQYKMAIAWVLAPEKYPSKTVMAQTDTPFTVFPSSETKDDKSGKSAR